MNYRWEGLIAFFGTKNLEETDRFYREILGLTLYKDQGICRIYNVPGGGKLGFCNHMEVVAQGKSPVITLLIEEVDEVYRKLLEKGIPVLQCPELSGRFEIYHFFLRDPNGYTVEIQRFLNKD